MAKKEFSLFHSFMQKIASSRPGAWFFARTQHHFDRLLLKLTNNKTTLTSILSGLPVVMLTSTGAKSGVPRTVPLIGIQDETGSGKIALIASNWGQKHHPGWYYNLKANPQVHCWIAGKDGNYTAHEAEDEEYDHYWQTATEMYGGYSQYKQRVGERQIHIMVLTPTTD